jgi:hypothetical protein
MYQARTSPLPVCSTAGIDASSPATDSDARALHVSPPSLERRVQICCGPRLAVAPSYSRTTLPLASAEIALWPR